MTSRGGNVDIAPRGDSLVRVSRFRHRFAAVFLLAFWLLATQHCALEAAGVFESHEEAANACCPDGEPHCAHDGCQIVEGHGFNTASAAKAPQPQLTLCVCLIGSTVPPPALERIPRGGMDEFGRPLDWVASWKFLQRVALSPRAPSLV